MDAGIAACHLGHLQILLRQFLRPAKRLTVWHDFSDDSPLERDAGCKRLRVQQKRLSSTWSSPIAPRRKDSVARHNTAGKVGQIVEGGAFRRHNHAGEKGIFGVHVRPSLDGRDQRHTDVRDVLDKLSPFIMNLAPNAGIGNVAEGRKIDTGNELPACSGQNYDLVRAILRDAVESIDELGVILRRKGEWPAVGMKLGD